MMATQAGMILGTAAYMSPEQAHGSRADHRSDVFSFGVVLYEMLTGRQPFQGETAPDVLASVLVARSDPGATASRPVAATVRTGEALPRQEPEAALAGHRRRARGDRSDRRGAARRVDDRARYRLLRPLWRRAMPMVATAVGAGGPCGPGRMGRDTTASPLVARFTFALPEGEQFTNAGRQAIAISPDGTQIVYVANQRLYLRRISELEARAIPGTDGWGGTLNPAFSPDGRFIVFWATADSDAQDSRRDWRRGGDRVPSRLSTWVCAGSRAASYSVRAARAF